MKADATTAPSAGGADADDLSGQLVGGYRITRVIGRGGMGVIYLGEHPTLGKRVAVKVIPREQADNEDLRRRFIEEARRVASVTSPHVVEIHDLALLPDGRFYMTMELLEGESLAQRLARGAIPQAEALDLAMQMLAGIAAIHERGLVHRDIKPSNLFLATSPETAPQLKVLDFGLAKLRDPSSATGGRVTLKGTVLGTPGYMSPEQGRGEDVDARADVYAMGVVMYEMLAHRPLFESDDLSELMEKHATAAPAPLPSDVPSAVAGVVMRALAKDLRERYADAQEMRRALADVTADASSVTSGDIRSETRGDHRRERPGDDRSGTRSDNRGETRSDHRGETRSDNRGENRGNNRGHLAATPGGPDGARSSLRRAALFGVPVAIAAGVAIWSSTRSPGHERGAPAPQLAHASGSQAGGAETQAGGTEMHAGRAMQAEGAMQAGGATLQSAVHLDAASSVADAAAPMLEPSDAAAATTDAAPTNTPRIVRSSRADAGVRQAGLAASAHVVADAGAGPIVQRPGTTASGIDPLGPAPPAPPPGAAVSMHDPRLVWGRLNTFVKGRPYAGHLGTLAPGSPITIQGPAAEQFYRIRIAEHTKVAIAYDREVTFGILDPHGWSRCESVSVTYASCLIKTTGDHFLRITPRTKTSAFTITITHNGLE